MRPGTLDILEGGAQTAGKSGNVVGVFRVVGGCAHVVVGAVIHDNDNIHLIHIHGFHDLHGFRIPGVRLIAGNGGYGPELIVAEAFHHIKEIKMVFCVFRVIHGILTGSGGIGKSAVVNNRTGFGGDLSGQSGGVAVIRERIVSQT